MADNGKTRLTFDDVERGASTARAGKKAGNSYLPEVATVVQIIEETPTIKTFRMRFDDPAVQESFSFMPGQVGQLGIFGVGESTFAISSKPSEKEFIQFSVMKAGEVTKALHNLSVGDKVGVRAPMGCGFPVEAWKGKRILYVLGGIGSAALEATIEYTLEHRADYAGISILYGATHPTNSSSCRKSSRPSFHAWTRLPRMSTQWRVWVFASQAGPSPRVARASRRSSACIRTNRVCRRQRWQRQ